MAITEPREGIEYVASISESGLLIEIEAFQNGERINYVQIARSAWPAVVQAVAESMTAQRVEAQIDTILGAADLSAED